MIEINYDANTVMRGNYPIIKKLGACSPRGEMTPFVWEGRLYRSELAGDDYAGADTIIRDVETGKVIASLAKDSYFTSAFVDDDEVYVLGVDKEKRDTINIFKSRDLVNWKKEILLTNPGWTYYNTSLTKNEEGYVLALESDHADFAGSEPFTIFFAKSSDLKEWEHLDPTRFTNSKERYSGGPWFKYSEGWYYLITVTMLPCKRFTNYIFRSKDLETWYVGYYNPILMPDADDRKISPNHAADLEDKMDEILHGGFNINNSDIDMCDWQGKTYINYFTGNQLGTSWWMMEAEYDGTVAEFLKSYFE
ncbi:MAG: hypothetical protein IKU65_02855 [Oscillospiraceae bacterium]|nr:hypothetical protein [Oscillospiraceae bacterium]